MKRYNYSRVHVDNVNSVLKEYAESGWTVHTLHRNHNAEVIDILFEYEYGQVTGR
jgi:hypothetical protein